MKKIVLCILATILLATSLMPSHLSYSQSQKTFTDVTQAHWAYPFISYLSANDFIAGYTDGTFRPNNNIRIDEFIAITVNALGYRLESKSSDWSKPFIEKAIELRIIEDLEFSSYSALITREQMLSIATNALKTKAMIPTSTLDVYVKSDIKDFHYIDDYYKQNIIDAYKFGLSVGLPDGSFQPKNQATRAEASVVINMLHRDDMRVPYVKKDALHTEMRTHILNNEGKYVETTHILYAPIFNGKPVNEIVEFAELIKANSDIGKGFLGYASNPMEQKYSFSAYRDKMHYEDIFNNASIREQSFLYAERMDIGFVVNYTDLASEWNPYDVIIWKKNQSVRDEDYPTYFFNTYGDQMKVFFDYLFEADSPRAWQLFTDAIKYSQMETVYTIEYLNGRRFYLYQSSSAVKMRISLRQ